MRELKKYLSLIIIFIIIFLGAICCNVYSAQTNSTNTSSSNTTTTTTGNANLKNLGIRPNDFTGFKADTTSYSVTVPVSTEAVEVYATAQNSKATITGTGTKKLDIGNNKLVVNVMAEDGTEKSYTINVTRKGKGDSTEGNTENVSDRYTGEGLSKLIVNGDLQLNPQFDTNIYEYNVKYIGSAESVNIETETTDPYYTVDVTGNYNLIEGENIITILVSDPDGINVATYQLKVNKSLVDEEAVKKQEQEKADKQKKIIIGAVSAVIIIIVLIVIIKIRRNRRYEDEYGFYDDEYDEEDNDYNDYYEIRKKSTKRENNSDDDKPKIFKEDKNDDEPEISEENEIEEEPSKKKEEKSSHEENIENEDKDELKKR